ncbi:single-stranded DNA-binding protein [Lactococcus lactis]|uniref:single-stranded DNA-binding protein n=1 Tax=Lactococcus lactis TaxID=1358 RepID=UPI0025A29260|nr:single-stranded DNA-binding protein [Lactococcus lactis]MDM7536381.1 single-stranded DNA-binding protein [Lactococcus lactis]
MNTTFGTGRVAKKPIFDTTKNGVPRLSFQFAMDSSIKEGDEYLSYYVSVVVYGTRAMTMAEWLTVGSPLAISGEQGTRTYDKNEVRQYYTFLRLDKYQRLESRDLANLRKVNNEKPEVVDKGLDEEMGLPNVGRGYEDY